MKRSLSVVLVLCLLISLPLSAGAANISDMTDVKNDWYYNAVEYCLENGLMNGMSSTSFAPGGKVSRAQIAQVLYNREGSPATAGLANPFTDVKSTTGTWYYDAVVWGRANQVIFGQTEALFGPGAQVTRQDICTMVYRYYTGYLGCTAQLADESAMAQYADWPNTAGYAREPLRWAVQSGFMSGKGQNRLDPTGKATRAELAQFLLNLDTLSQDGPARVFLYDPDPPAASFTSLDDEKRGSRYEYNRDILAPSIEETVRQGIWKDPGTGNVEYDCDYSTTWVPGAEGAQAHTGYIPLGGYAADGSALSVQLGSLTYTKAAPGVAVYNRYGQDVSSVDGVPTAFEEEVVQALKSFQNQRPGTTLSFDPMLQMAAEAGLVETIENTENLAKAGLTAGLYRYGSPVLSYYRPGYTRALLESSKTARSYDELDWDRALQADIDDYRIAQDHSSTALPSSGILEYFGAGMLMEHYQGVNSDAFRFGTKPSAALVAATICDSSNMAGLCQPSPNTVKIGIAFDENTNTYFCLAAPVLEDPTDDQLAFYRAG